MLVWQLLTSGEPFPYGEPRSLQDQTSPPGCACELRADSAAAEFPRGTPLSPQYGHARTRALPSLALSSALKNPEF